MSILTRGAEALEHGHETLLEQSFGHYEVLVGVVADFLVRAETELEAQQAVSEHCENVPNLGIHPDNHLDLFLARPLSQEEAAHRDKVAKFTNVTLIRFFEYNPLPLEDNKITDRNQKTLFQARDFTGKYYKIDPESGTIS